MVSQSHSNCYEACLKDNFLLAFQLILARIVATWHSKQSKWQT